ncbi:MAG TPA: efflux RND transporter periplasmic adaptor subunit [Rhodanobacteraceae bacterium]|nr:efflux RND transporter periplasmic adaptor subunit [Rhodanobacteraceae bacterium]
MSSIRFAAPLLLACAGVLALAACASKSEPAPKANADAGLTLTSAQRKHIHLYTVTRKAWHETRQLTGVVDYDHDQATPILAPMSGQVTRVLVSVGDTVRKGQALARVDSPDFTQAIGDYRQALAQARSDRKQAQQASDLLAHQGISAVDAAQAQNAAIAAETARDAALRKLQALDVPASVIKAIDAGKPAGRVAGVIRAPIAGTVVARSITPGQRIAADSTTCFTVANLSRMWVKARLFDSDMQAVSVGDDAKVWVAGGGKPFPGKVTAVSAMVNPATGAATARVEVANPGDRLKKDMFVRVDIAAKQSREDLMVPMSAVLRDADNRPFVYVTDKQHRFVRRQVKLGYRNGQDVVVASGLEAGQKVVSDGGIFLRFMQTQ